MGKSAFLIELEQHLSNDHQDVVTIRLASAPVMADLTGALAQALGVPKCNDPVDALRAWIDRHMDQHLVILYDELDGYIHLPTAIAFFRALESAVNELPVGLVGAGGLGLLVLKDTELGSAFLSRAPRKLLTPLTREEILKISEAFEPPLTEEVLDTLWRLSGGNPALATFGLEALWACDVASRTADALIEAFGTFIEESDGFLDMIVQSVSIRGRVRTAASVLEFILNTDGPYHAQQLASCVVETDRIDVKPKQAIDVLRASGLVHVDGRSSVDPIHARPIHSILLDRFRAPRPESLVEPDARLQAHLLRICAEIHRLSVDFYKGKATIARSLRRARFPRSSLWGCGSVGGGPRSGRRCRSRVERTSRRAVWTARDMCWSR